MLEAPEAHTQDSAISGYKRLYEIYRMVFRCEDPLTGGSKCLFTSMDVLSYFPICKMAIPILTCFRVSKRLHSILEQCSPSKVSSQVLDTEYS